MGKNQKIVKETSRNINFVEDQEDYKANLSGKDIIKLSVKNFPYKPGVYQMENEKGEILYIGKAKNLKKRVVTYSNQSGLTRRLQRMVSQTKTVNFTVTNSEIDALLLECTLIKRVKPKFNIILRDDKSFPYILINKEHSFPRILKYRGQKRFKGNYYGPFVSPSTADYTLLSIQKTFLLRSCSDGVFSNRSRPCILYDIKRCSAPCVKKINEKKYKESIDDAKKFLSGKTKFIEKKLNNQMNIASKNQAYEEASRLRDRIKSLKQIQKYQSVYIKDLRNIDIFAIKILNGRSCIFGMFYRNGSNYGNKAFYPSHDENSNEVEILDSFLFQFYSNKDSPPKILVNIDSSAFNNVQKVLSEKNKILVKIINPKIGEKLKHIKLAEKNALENIKLKNQSFQEHYRLLNKFKNFFNLNQLPNRIEIYDNSHTFGNQSLGVMIVVNQEGFESKSYRKFNIKFDMLKEKSHKSNDYYMLEEVLNRRLLRIDNQEEWTTPDIIIVDGGKGHFNLAKKILNKHKRNQVKLISVAKGIKRNSGREIIYSEEKEITIKGNDPLLHFIQRMRDEAHRFAINSHRKRRFKESIKSVFDEIQGIGLKRKKILLEHFGSVKKISTASIDELNEIKGINKNLAEEIYGFFNSQN